MPWCADGGVLTFLIRRKSDPCTCLESAKFRRQSAVQSIRLRINIAQANRCVVLHNESRCKFPTVSPSAGTLHEDGVRPAALRHETTRTVGQLCADSRRMVSENHRNWGKEYAKLQVMTGRI